MVPDGQAWAKRRMAVRPYLASRKEKKKNPYHGGRGVGGPNGGPEDINAAVAAPARRWNGEGREWGSMNRGVRQGGGRASSSSAAHALFA